MRFFLYRQEYPLSRESSLGYHSDECKSWSYLQHCSPKLAHSGAPRTMEVLHEEHCSLLSSIHGSKMIQEGTAFVVELRFPNNNSTDITVTVNHQEPCTDTQYFDSCFRILNFQLRSKDQMPCSLFLTNHPFYCFWHSYRLRLIKKFIYENGAFA